MGWTRPLPQVWTIEDHRKAMTGVNLVKGVHVSAVGAAEYASVETAWLARVCAEKLPVALIGTVDLRATLRSIEQVLDTCMRFSNFRGIRIMQPIDYASAHGSGLLRLLSQRNLLYDAVSYLDGGIAALADAAARFPELQIVVEHTGWPPSQSQRPAHFREWQANIKACAALENCHAKLSGLGMVYHRTSTQEFLPYFEWCLEHFGARRCMFASNYPVDTMYGSFSELLDVFDATAAALSPAEQASVFSATAERVYRI
jgi:predicted TIM-barrel fold metal-dependent hydrolase